MASAAEIRSMVDSALQAENEAMILLQQGKARMDDAVQQLEAVRTDQPAMQEAIQYFRSVQSRVDEAAVLAMNGEQKANEYTTRL